MRKVTSFVAGLVLLVGTSSALEAQATRGGAGLMLGAAGTWTPSFDLEANGEFNGDATIEAGFGFAARAGFAFTPVFVIFAGYEQSWHGIENEDEDADMRYIMGGVRINLPVAPSLAPYVSGGWGERRLTADINDPDFGTANIRMTGNFWDVGGGIQVFLAPSLALDLGANYSFGSFDEVSAFGETVGIGDIDANILRLRVGLTWTPMTRR